MSFTIAAAPPLAQSSLNPSPAGLINKFYCHSFETSINLTWLILVRHTSNYKMTRSNINCDWVIKVVFQYFIFLSMFRSDWPSSEGHDQRFSKDESAFSQHILNKKHLLCGLVIRVPGYKSRGPGFDSRRCQIFWEVVGLERDPLSLVRIIEELLERKVAAPVYKTEINGRGDSLRWPLDTLYALKLAPSSTTSSGLSVGIVRWRTISPEFILNKKH
jgi:hypothetical protein